MGYTADYNFDFVNDASKLSMTVGQGAGAKTYSAEKIADNKYGFAPREITIQSDKQRNISMNWNMFRATTNKLMNISYGRSIRR